MAHMGDEFAFAPQAQRVGRRWHEVPEEGLFVSNANAIRSKTVCPSRRTHNLARGRVSLTSPEAKTCLRPESQGIPRFRPRGSPKKVPERACPWKEAFWADQSLHTLTSGLFGPVTGLHFIVENPHQELAPGAAGDFSATGHFRGTARAGKDDSSGRFDGRVTESWDRRKHKLQAASGTPQKILREFLDSGTRPDPLGHSFDPPSTSARDANLPSVSAPEESPDAILFPPSSTKPTLLEGFNKNVDVRKLLSQSGAYSRETTFSKLASLQCV